MVCGTETTWARDWRACWQHMESALVKQMGEYRESSLPAPPKCRPRKLALLRQALLMRWQAAMLIVPKGMFGTSDAPGDECAAVVDGGVDDLSPLQLWDQIMRRYKVAQECERLVSDIDAKENPSERERLLAERSIAVAAAVQALAKLKNRETQQKLDAFMLAEQGRLPTVKLEGSTEILSNFDKK